MISIIKLLLCISNKKKERKQRKKFTSLELNTLFFSVLKEDLFKIKLRPELTECLQLKSWFLISALVSSARLLDITLITVRLNFLCFLFSNQWGLCSRDISKQKDKWWTEILASWPSQAAVESSAHRAGKPDDCTHSCPNWLTGQWVRWLVKSGGYCWQRCS